MSHRDLNVHSILTSPEGPESIRAVLRVGTIEIRPLADDLRRADFTVLWPPGNHGRRDLSPGLSGVFLRRRSPVQSPPRGHDARSRGLARAPRPARSSPPPATREEILDVHEEYYVRRVEELSLGRDVPDREEYGLDTPDTPAFPGMDRAARWHVGGTLHGARLICGEPRARAPAGRRAPPRPAELRLGFCVYNDIAIAIRHLTRQGLWVLYVDVDVHHGDGVQQILDDDRRVMTVSLHESGKYLFPGTGEVHELGSGVGRGLKLNVPLEPFTEGESYREVFEEVVSSALRYFRPGVLVVQAGADAHCDDALVTSC